MTYPTRTAAVRAQFEFHCEFGQSDYRYTIMCDDRGYTVAVHSTRGHFLTYV